MIDGANEIRKKAGVSVMIKFTNAARVYTYGISNVEGLNLFTLVVKC